MSIVELQEKVRWLQEPEFGDFKRKLGLYLEQAREQSEANSEIEKVLRELKYQVVYAPNGDMEATRSLVLAKLQNAL